MPSLPFRSIPLLLLASALAAPSHANAGCASAKRSLDKFLRGLPRSCSQDSDCDAYYYRTDGCLPPLVLRKPGVVVGSPEYKRLLAFQARARETCLPETSKQGPCSPMPAVPECQHGTCRDRLNAPPSLDLRPTPSPAPLTK